MGRCFLSHFSWIMAVSALTRCQRPLEALGELVCSIQPSPTPVGVRESHQLSCHCHHVLVAGQCAGSHGALAVPMLPSAGRGTGRASGNRADDGAEKGADKGNAFLANVSLVVPLDLQHQTPHQKARPNCLV